MNVTIKNLLCRILALLAIFSLTLSSCGFKGPLYLPKKPAASKPVASSIKSAGSPQTAKLNSSSVAIPIVESGTVNKN